MKIKAPKPGKTRITIRLDNEVLDWFRGRVEAKGGGSYQSMINDALRNHIEHGEEGLEALLRRVIREELGTKGSDEALFSLPPGNL
jgi:metal-responsive CopG/Arc/MetJ family transcriptional regulator